MLVSVVLLIDVTGIPGAVTVYARKTKKIIVIKVLIINTLLTQFNYISVFHMVAIEVIRCTHNGYVVAGSILQTSQ